MVFLGSLRKLQGAKAQQPLSSEILVCTLKLVFQKIVVAALSHPEFLVSFPVKASLHVQYDASTRM